MLKWHLNFCLVHTQLGGLLSHKRCSGQIGHHYEILEEYTNGDGIHINKNASVKCC
jgi:hypothetical protein